MSTTRQTTLTKITNSVICVSFCRKLAHDFLTMREKAENMNDHVSVKSTEVIIKGFADLLYAASTNDGAEDQPFRFNGAAYTTYLNLAKNPNDLVYLRSAGELYLYEWRLPKAALRFFETAASLDPTDARLLVLIDVANRAIANGTAQCDLRSASA